MFSISCPRVEITAAHRRMRGGWVGGWVGAVILKVHWECFASSCNVCAVGSFDKLCDPGCSIRDNSYDLVGHDKS